MLRREPFKSKPKRATVLDVHLESRSPNMPVTVSHVTYTFFHEAEGAQDECGANLKHLADALRTVEVRLCQVGYLRRHTALAHWGLRARFNPAPAHLR